MEIKQVSQNRSNGSKFVYLSKNSKIQPGDFVKITKLKFVEDGDKDIE